MGTLTLTPAPNHNKKPSHMPLFLLMSFELAWISMVLPQKPHYVSNKPFHTLLVPEWLYQSPYWNQLCVEGLTHPLWCNPNAQFLRQVFSNNYPRIALPIILYLIVFSMSQSSQMSLMHSIVFKTSKIAMICPLIPSTKWPLHLQIGLSLLYELPTSQWLGYDYFRSTSLLTIPLTWKALTLFCLFKMDRPLKSHIWDDFFHEFC